MTLLFEHPEFYAKKNKWVKWRDLYQNDHSVMTGSSEYFWPHAMELKESPESRNLLASRKKRTRCLNLTEILVSLWCGYFFKEDPELDEEAKALLEMDNAEDNIDGYGTSFCGLIRERVAPNYLLYGKPILLVDSFQYQPQTGAEEQQMGMRPFITCIDPLDATDWEHETSDPARMGRLNSFRYEFLQQVPRASLLDQPRTLMCTYVMQRETAGAYSVKKFYAELDRQGNILEQFRDKQTMQIQWRPNGEAMVNLPELPVSLISRESWVKDAAEEALRHFNLRSNLDNVNYFQGYDTKFITGINPSDAPQYQAMTEYSAVFLPEGATPIKLPANDPVALERAVADALMTTFKVGLNQLRAIPLDSKAVQGADTQAEDKDYQHALVESSIEDLENICNQALQHYAAFKGIKNFTGEICFNKEISEQDTDKFISVWTATRDSLLKVDGLEKSVIKKLISKLELDDADELIDAVDRLPDKSQTDLYKPMAARGGLITKALGKDIAKPETEAGKANGGE